MNLLLREAAASNTEVSETAAGGERRDLCNERTLGYVQGLQVGAQMQSRISELDQPGLGQPGATPQPETGETGQVLGQESHGDVGYLGV